MNFKLPSLKEAQSARARSKEPKRALFAPVQFRPYQLEAFANRTNGIEVWNWGRQTGKSFTLAAWAVDRLITKPGRLVTILSNSRANGAELNRKCAEFCERHRHEFEQADLSGGFQFDAMNYETRIYAGGMMGRIKVLPASPRTARGFSGDLILDEFAFHDDSRGIWEAAEPILSANQDFLCRIASTPNGRHNMFYHLATTPGIFNRTVPRSLAWQQGLPIYHPLTRAVITPEEARELATNKDAYDENYECAFGVENMRLLSLDLISQAEDDEVGLVCEGKWSEEAIKLLTESEITGSLYVGVDVGRHRDWTVMTVVEQRAHDFLVRAILRLRNVSLPEQQERLAEVCGNSKLQSVCIDMTGMGVGLLEYAQKQFGWRVFGVNFAGTLPVPSFLLSEATNASSVRAPELLALRLLRLYNDRLIKHPRDPILRDDLNTPERVMTQSGKVSIAAERSSEGHADHFWSLALAAHAVQSYPAPGPFRGQSASYDFTQCYRGGPPRVLWESR